MVEDGPIIGWYDMYTTHTPYTILKRKGTVLVTDEGEEMVHTVTLTGFKKWRSHGKMKGYWEFLNSGGLAWGRDGFGRIAFNAIKGVEILTPSLL